MYKSTCAYFITAALSIATLFSSGCGPDGGSDGASDDGSTGGGSSPGSTPVETLKPYKAYYSVFTDGKRTGYSVVEFRIEDGKAVTESKSYKGRKSHPLDSDIKWRYAGSFGSVETLDGKPVSYWEDMAGYGKSTFVAGADGKASRRFVRHGEKESDDEMIPGQTIDWPGDAVLWYGTRLIMQRKGLKEGTRYSYTQLLGGAPVLLNVQVGPTKNPDAPGGGMKLTEVTRVWDKMPEHLGDKKPFKYILHIDSDFIPRKLEMKMGSEKIVMTACDEAQATRRQTWNPLAAPKPSAATVKRKPFTVYYSMFSNGKKVGFSIYDFRIEDNKAITTRKISRAVMDYDSTIKWELDNLYRHIETLDGRPLVQTYDQVGRRKTTETAGEDGLAYTTSIDHAATKPSVWHGNGIEWPKDAILDHGRHLLMKRKGTAQGTSYSFAQLLTDRLTGTTRITVGPTRRIDVMGRKMKLTEMTCRETFIFPPPNDPSETTLTMYMDADLIMRKVVSGQGEERFTVVSCGKEEAMKLPTTLPEPIARPRKNPREQYPTTRSGSTTRTAPTTRRYRD